MSGKQQAPKGKVWQCRACSKRSRDQFGDDAIDWGWDESCVLNAQLVSEGEAKVSREEYLKAMEENNENGRE